MAQDNPQQASRQSWWQMLREVVTKWSDHDAASQSAALAFYTLFSLAPVLIVVIAVAGAVFGKDAVRGQIVAEFSGLMGPEAARVIQEVIRSAAQPATGRWAAILGLLTLLFGATGVFVQLQDALNRVWDVKPRPGAVFTTLLKKRLLSFSMVLGIGFLLMVSLVLSAALTAVGQRLERFAAPAGILEAVNFLVSFVAVTLLFGLIYRLLPDVHLSWRDVGTGAFITALLFVAGKTLIGFYLGRTSTASAYGAAGSLVVLLLWVYYSSLIFFFGAELTRIVSRRHRKEKAKPEEGAEHHVHPAATAIFLVLLLGAGTAHAAEKLKIEVDGVSGDLKRNVLATLSLEEARKKRKKELTEELIRRLHGKAPDEIATALQPFGYYRPQVQSHLEREGTTWVARYHIDSGPRLSVNKLDLRVDGPGAGDPGFRERVQSFPLQQGAPLYHPAYEAGKESLVDYAAAHGYLDADYKVHQIRIDQAAYTCDVVLHFETGPQYLFGPVRFHQDFLDPDLLRGYVTFKEGETLNVQKLLAMQTALSGSPYFQRVEVLPQEEQAQGLEVPVDVNLVPSKPQRWHFGLGYGTDTGPRGTASLELRHINREGHHAQAEVTASEIDKSFTADYQIPGAYPRTDVISFDAGYAFLNPKTSESRIFKLSTGLSRSVGEWRQAFSLGFQREQFTIGLDKGTSRLLIPDATWSLVRADSRIYTSHGQKVQLQIRGAENSVLSNATFVQESVQGTFIRSFAERFRFISRAQVGDTQTNDFHTLPPTIRFFAGGDQSVRGYAYQELGEKDAAGHVIGGRALRTASVEIDYTYLEHWKFLDKWGVAAFFDAGNATSSLSSGTLERGAGLGLRWVSPIGPIHIDFARALTQPGQPLRIHFTVGPDL